MSDYKVVTSEDIGKGTSWKGESVDNIRRKLTEGTSAKVRKKK